MFAAKYNTSISAVFCIRAEKRDSVAFYFVKTKNYEVSLHAKMQLFEDFRPIKLEFAFHKTVGNKSNVCRKREEA